MSRSEVARIIREEARLAGFSGVGISEARTPPGFERFRSWIASGRHAGMAYLERTREIREDPRRLLPGARSVVSLSARHSASAWRASDGAEVARYAAGPDYHGTLRERALRVVDRVTARIGGGRYRVCVDSTPLAERSFAAASGIGWIGKNGCLIDPELGSFLLLAEIVTDLDLPPDDPIAEQCGSCVRCLDACPTNAFVAPGLLDAARCLAYWTIEHRGPLPDAIKGRVDEHVFGCDVCQEVCPWNARPLAAAGPSPQPPPSREEWLAMGPGEWRRRFGGTALNRAGRRGVQRNAAASAGCAPTSRTLPSLERAAAALEPGIRDAAAWSLRRMASLPAPD